MPTAKIYTVDAFTDKPFKGNTCAVCLFPEWPSDEVLQNIAKQNLFAETAFIGPQVDGRPELRWFTVSQEVDFCGYGTLSAGYVYLNHVTPTEPHVVFATRHYGPLPVTRYDQLYQIEVPAKPTLERIFDEAVRAALGGPKPVDMITSARGDLVITYSNEQDVRSVQPDFLKLMATGYYGYVLTSIGDSADYAYRYFSPRMTSVWEDPVNGASQSVLVPYWSEKLHKNSLHGQAVSQRGGDLYCEYDGRDKVKIGGRVSPYLMGELTL